MSPLKPRAVRVRLLASFSLFVLSTVGFLSCQSFRKTSGTAGDSKVASVDPTAFVQPAPEEAENSVSAAVLEGRDVDLQAAALSQDGSGAACAAAIPLLRAYFATSEDLPADSVKRAMTLYLSCHDAEAPAVFDQLASKTRPATRSLAWYLARNRPSSGMAKKLGLRLTSALSKTDLDGLATAQVAEAVAANRVPESYTFLRKGFATSQRAEFLKAMLAVDPEHARDDALSYLSKATFEELSAGELKNVDPAVCKEVLAYFADYPPPLNHPNLGHLFLFAVSADKTLSSRALEVLAKMATKQSSDLAAAFTKMSRDAQMAYAARLREVTQAGSAEALTILRREIHARVTDKEVLSVLDRGEQGAQ